MPDSPAHADLPSPVILTLVRHGMTAWAASGQHTSITDISLDALGEAQARALKPVLALETFDAVYSSPLQRARQTAGLAGFADAAVEADLTEWRYGRYEGRTTAEIQADDPDWSIFRCGAPGGETPADVAARCDRLLEGWARQHHHVLCFAHGHILRALACRWLGQPLDFGNHLHLDPGSMCRLGWEHQSPALHLWNAVPGPDAVG